MNWGKPNYEKQKVNDEAAVEAKYAALGKLVHKFLSGYHANDLGGWPDKNLYLGTDFEIGGAHENYGFGVYKLYHTEEGDKLKLLSEDKTLTGAIEKAKTKLRCSHQFEHDTGWCKLCNAHKTELG